MEPWLEISGLSIEVTRKCNMACPHCLRKASEDKSMTPELLRTFLENVASIDEVTFSGGEPSLRLDVIEAFYRLCDELGITVNSFFVATNGKENQLELAMLLLREYEKAEWQDSCAVALSVDGLHEPGVSRIVKGLAFYSDVKEHDPSDQTWIIPEGSAYENGLGEYRCRNTNGNFSTTDPNGDGHVKIESMYLSANGYVYSDPDLSYDEMDCAIDDPESCPAAFFEAGAMPRTESLWLGKEHAG